MKLLYFRMDPLRGTRGTSDAFQTGQTKKSGSSNLDQSAMATVDKVSNLISSKYEPVSKWDSDQTFEAASRKMHDRSINLGSGDRDSTTIITPHDPRITGG